MGVVDHNEIMVQLHTRYVSVADLSEDELEVAREWIDYVRRVSKQCSENMAAYLDKSERVPN